MKKSLLLFLLCGLTVLLVGCSNITTVENQEYTILTDESLGLQLQRPNAWGELVSYKTVGINVGQISLRILDNDKPYYEREKELMTLYFIDKDEYPLLLKELPYARGETIGYNDTYYFVLYIHEDKIEEFVELTPRVDKETVLEYFIHTGFSISPTKEVPTLIKSPERTGNQLLYRDEEHGFQITFPKEFEEMKIYTKYATTGTFDRQEYDIVIFTLPRPDKHVTSHYLPNPLLGYQEFIRITCIPIHTYITITNWGFGGREYLEEQTLGHNNDYYFVVYGSNMGEGIKDLFPQWNEKKYKDASVCEYLNDGTISVGCRLDNISKKGFSSI